jgi:putative transposase
MIVVSFVCWSLSVLIQGERRSARSCGMSRSGNVWDNAAMEGFFSSLKTERTAHKIYRTRDRARADTFDYIECFYNPGRRHSTIGYLSPMEFEQIAIAS